MCWATKGFEDVARKKSYNQTQRFNNDQFAQKSLYPLGVY